MSTKPGATTWPCTSMALTGGIHKISNRGDLALANTKITGVPRRPGAIDDVSIGEHEIEGLGEDRRGKARRKKQARKNDRDDCLHAVSPELAEFECDATDDFPRQYRNPPNRIQAPSASHS